MFPISPLIPLQVYPHTSNDWLCPASFPPNVLVWLLSSSHSLFYVFSLKISQKPPLSFTSCAPVNHFTPSLDPRSLSSCSSVYYGPCTSSPCHSPVSCYTIIAAHTISPSLSLQKYRQMVQLKNVLSKWLYLVTISLSFSVSSVPQD